MKVLVTGTKGQLGYDVVNELEKRGHTAVAVDMKRWILQMLFQLRGLLRKQR